MERALFLTVNHFTQWIKNKLHQRFVDILIIAFAIIIMPATSRGLLSLLCILIDESGPALPAMARWHVIQKILLSTAGLSSLRLVGAYGQKPETQLAIWMPGASQHAWPSLGHESLRYGGDELRNGEGDLGANV